ncbi:uncharacterized protein SPAPADRAFT_61700 [Spathaspora passalidarum NRRL Y-27907]|uniref:RBR-type E3 ubiquitin transferase n=1 Tax=Spathaspora passalidarum (strain NRRL Y-27907 / 11-Y1) TaxID=619300 RepID=G3AP69_SPAPN|nr:uncharacterized protein SPAPADRAFT_61700 [Spathaspora passalidarum NRRL Y-27907]EGW32640.1 hypothetical protein SPAPADRAFT_61700 [Spathaspora passalidarum NRRL Y-27907]
MSDDDSDIFFEYEYDQEDDLDESSFCFSSDGEDDVMFDVDGENSDTPQTKISDTLANVGANGTLYYPWNVEQFIENKLLAKLDKLANGTLTACSIDELLIMLQVKGWQEDEVLNDYFDNRDKLYEACGLPVGVPMRNTLKKIKNYSCFVCCEDYSETYVYSLTCGHTYCINCYYSYISNELANGGPITCIEPDCKYTIPYRDVTDIFDIVNKTNHGGVTTIKSMVENPLLVANTKAMINSKRKYKWCPATDCNGFAELVGNVNDSVESLSSAKESVDISKVPIVTCSENHEFCFDCNYENHLPCPCWIVKKWIKKCNDDSETANWIDANTHGCPQCQSAIEKNGGCNHMTCKKCKFEFCWICFEDWKKHRNDYYSCNKYRNERQEDEQRKNRSKQSLERYLHFYKRFAIHENSMKGDLKTMAQIDTYTRLYMEDLRDQGKKNLSWNDIQFLPTAMRALQNGRKALKWTYCFAYYLGKSNFATIFEGNQDFLNKTVEDLSEVFEQIMSKKNPDKVGMILKNKTKLRNLSELVNSRKNMLINGARANLDDGLLWFDNEI